LIPERVAIALQEDGWILRNDIIWHKPNHMPSSVKDRLTNSWEHLYFFVKNRRYFFDLDSIRQPHRREFEKESWFKKQLETKHTNRAWSNDPLMERGKQSTFYHNTLGKCPDDVYQGKFDGFAEESGSSRIRNERKPYSVQERNKEFVEVRNLPSIKEIANYLNEWRKKQGFTIEDVETKLESQAPHHWFNAESYPTKEDWLQIKTLLQFDETYDKLMMKSFLKLAEKQDNPLGKNPSDTIVTRGLNPNKEYKSRDPERHVNLLGKNVGDFWSITTQPFKGAHFAVYPERLCEMPIKATCPQWICNRCGKPKTRITKTTYAPQGNKKEENKARVPHPRTELDIELGRSCISDYRPQAMKFGRAEAQRETIGWSSCNCNVGYHSGIVLDPMCGSGTTLLVARKLCRNFIGIELNPAYVEMANKRLAQIPQRIDSMLLRGA